MKSKLISAFDKSVYGYSKGGLKGYRFSERIQQAAVSSAMFDADVRVDSASVSGYNY
jgi:hypothetical protein